MRIKLYNFFCIASLVVFAGCAHNKKNKYDAVSKPEDKQRSVCPPVVSLSQQEKELDASSGWFFSDDPDEVAIFQAKIADIPFPLGATLLSYQHQDAPAHQSLLTYSTHSSIESMVWFYKQHMERLGWRTMTEIAGTEGMLVYKKPHKMCVISLRSNVLTIGIDDTQAYQATA